MAPRSLLSLLVTLALIALSTASCLRSCRFTLCPPTPVDLTPSDKPLSSPICLRNRRIGIVNTADSFIRPPRATTFTPISTFSPPGLTQSFAPTFFKAFARTDNTSAVGHEVPQANQVEFLKRGTCVALRVRAYQVVKSVRGRRVVVDNVNINRNRPFKDCVSFVIGGIADASVSPPVTTGPPPTKLMTPSTTTTTATTTETASTTGPSTTTVATSTSTTVASTTTNAPITTTATTVDTTTTSTVPPIPEFVQPNDTVTFPPSINVGDKITFRFNVTVSAQSGSSKEDFYLLSDATSSMAIAIAEAKDRFSDIVDARTAASSDVAFGVGYYRDEREDDTFTNVQPITTDTTLAQEGIDTLVAQSAPTNLDGPEGNLVALYDIATKPNAIGWRPDSRRILVYFGDSPGHEPSCDDSLELTRANVIDALNKEKITVVASSFSGGAFSPGLNAATEQFSCPAGTDDAGEGQATAITEQTGGEVVEAEEQEELIETILQTVGDLGQELEADTSDCDSQDIDVSFEPSLPSMLAAGETLTIAETVMVNQSVCESGTGAFTCTVKFTLSGVPIGEQTLTSAGLAGC